MEELGRYTAADEAEVMAVPERDWAKVVVCFADGKPIQAVVPADHGVDLDELLKLTGATTMRLAHEHELRWLFPECELGAMKDGSRLSVAVLPAASVGIMVRPYGRIAGAWWDCRNALNMYMHVFAVARLSSIARR